MSITVVTTRDSDGVPTVRENYALGARWVVFQETLEVRTSAGAPLGLYASGNWLSVYADDTMTAERVDWDESAEDGLKRHKPAALPAILLADPVTPARPVAEVRSRGVPDGFVRQPEHEPAYEPEPLAAEVGDEPVVGLEDYEPLVGLDDSEDVPDDLPERVLDEPEPRPARTVAAPPDTPRVVTLPADPPAEPPRSSWMRRVSFQPRTLHRPEPSHPPEKHRWMRPVAFRARVYRRPSTAQEPDADPDEP